jgi:hypothetical protein
MVKIQCFYYKCMHLNKDLCSAKLIHVDPKKGCLDYSPLSLDRLESEWELNAGDSRDWALNDLDEWYGEDDVLDQDD